MARRAKPDPDDLQARTAARAYAIWESEGRPHGREYEHWLRAERELAAQADLPPPAPPQRPARKPAAKKPAAKPRKAQR